MGNYLCIDYGDKHCGLAMALTSIAEPVATIPTSKTLNQVMLLIQKHQISDLVFGLSEGVMAQKTKTFAQMLKQQTGLPIHFQDETLSSLETRQKIAQAGAKKSKKEAKIDHLVAAFILQDYLDNQVS